jgi:hypothetical protein
VAIRLRIEAKVRAKMSAMVYRSKPMVRSGSKIAEGFHEHSGLFLRGGEIVLLRP